MNRLPYNILIEIFKYIRYPASFARTNKLLSEIGKDPYARTRWLIYHFGEAHALYKKTNLSFQKKSFFFHSHK